MHTKPIGITSEIHPLRHAINRAFHIVLAALSAAWFASATVAAALPAASIVSVQASGSPGAYSFSVGVASPDLGCNQYADWWEVLSERGELLYRRILAHSHADEQPFVRSGGPVAVSANQVIWVRAHMHPGGYGGAVFRGSVQSGFREAKPEPGFAAAVAKLPPLPDGCAF